MDPILPSDSGDSKQPAFLACNGRDGIVSSQRGAVLVTGLIFLVILMLLGTTAMQGTLLEERMAGNLRDETLAFQAAEAALRSGERFLEQVTLPEFNGSDGLYHHADSPAPDPVNWQDWETSGKTIDVTMDGVASEPRYVIEQLPSVPLMGEGGSAQQSGSLLNASMFCVIARGVGGNDVTMVVLQSTYRR
ncbi:PilX N-terminal domain-containing pilus assembly protein [Nitrosomonas sp.]|uniref:pilus assembly PilX family protein n=1 Tax=Nitrosomonas sp. TaxID=42353 RepID=UPI003305A5F8